MKNSIILVTDEIGLADQLRAGLPEAARDTMTWHEGTLSRVNGTAVALAENHDVMMFRVGADLQRDVTAVRQLRQKAGSRCTIVALADANMSLASAKELERAGINEILTVPLEKGECARWYDEWLRRRSRLTLWAPEAAARPQGHVHAVAAARGGIGATTFAVNLADQLVERSGLRRKEVKNRIALVDFDLQFGSVASALDIEPSDALFTLGSEGKVPDAAFLREAMVTHASGIAVLAAPERFVPLDALNRAQVEAILTFLKANYDHIVIDLPRSLVDWVGPVLTTADRLFMVTDSTVPSIRQTRRLIDFFTEEAMNLKIEVVVTHERKPLISARHHVEAAKVLGKPLTHWLPHDPKAARQALDRGEVLSVRAGSAPLSKAIRNIGRGLTAEPKKTNNKHLGG